MSRRRRQPGGLTFDRRELLDLALAWVALSVAFAIFVDSGNRMFAQPSFALWLVPITAVTVGVGFLLHELAHKVVAVRLGQVAAFRADYGMLGLAIVTALAGFIFAAPGAVHHRGRITERENGLIAVAGPVTNLGLVAVFAPLLLLGSGTVFRVGAFGVLVNAFLAAFNMLPYGPLDGKTVYRWSPGVFVVVLLAGVALTAGTLLTVGLPLPV